VITLVFVSSVSVDDACTSLSGNSNQLPIRE
jgi:hypothetical protein